MESSERPERNPINNDNIALPPRGNPAALPQLSPRCISLHAADDQDPQCCVCVCAEPKGRAEAPNSPRFLGTEILLVAPHL